MGVPELLGADVHRHAPASGAGHGRPQRQLFTCQPHDQPPQRQDQPGLLGQRNELAGRNHAALRMHPAHQCLCAHHLALLVHHRLVVQQKLVALQRQPDIPLQRRPRAGGGLHGGVKKAQRIAPLDLGLVHGQVRTLKQFVHRLLRVPKQRDTDARRAVNLAFVHLKRFVQRCDDLLGNRFGLDGGLRLHAVQVLENQHKLITPEAGHGVHRPHTSLQALRHLNQQAVAPFVTERVVDGLEIVQVQKQQGSVALFARAQLGRLREPVQQQPAIGQPCELVIKREPLNLGLGLLALGDIACNAAIPGKPAFGIKDGFATDGYPDGRAVAAGAPHLEVMKDLVGLQLLAVLAPLPGRHHGVGQFPAGQAVLRFIRDIPITLCAAVEPDKPEVGVLLPVPVRGKMGEAAPARLALAQRLQRAQVIAHIREGAHAATGLQQPGAYFQKLPGAGFTDVGFGHIGAVDTPGLLRCHIRPCGRFNPLEIGPEISPLGLKTHHLFDPRLRCEQFFGQVEQLQITLVVDTDAPRSIHLRDALGNAGQRHFQGTGLFSQQRGRARQLGLDIAAHHVSPARQLQLPHRAEQRLQKLHIGLRIPERAVGQADHGDQLACSMDGQAQAGRERRMSQCPTRAALIRTREVANDRFARQQRLPQQGVQLVKDHSLRRRVVVRNGVRVGIGHGMHPQVRLPLGRALHRPHHPACATSQRHQFLQHYLERSAGGAAGNEEGLGLRDGLQ